MADRMEFPRTMKEFIDSYSFKDREEIYTNGAELIPVFRVEQAFEYYEKEIRNKAIDEFASELENHSIYADIGKGYEVKMEWVSPVTRIKEVAEQMKGSEENALD